MTTESGLPEPNAMLTLHEHVRLPLEMAVLLCAGEHKKFDRRWPRWIVAGLTPVWLLYIHIAGKEALAEKVGYYFWETPYQTRN